MQDNHIMTWSDIWTNKYSSNSTVVLATSKDIGKPGPLIDKLIYEKSNSLHCPLVIINGNLEDKQIEKIIINHKSKTSSFFQKFQ